MDEHDRDNLNFLLTVDSDTLQDWYGQATQDDIAYALELLSYANKENIRRLANLGVNVMSEDDIDVTLANTVLSKFRLNHTKN